MFEIHQTPKRKNFFGLVLGTFSLFIIASAAYGAQQSLRSNESVKPNNGIATFDPLIQKTTEKILSKYIKKFDAKGGFVIIVDSRNGKVLASVNQRNQKNRAEKNWALSYRLEPASVMKGIVVASALEEKVTTPNEELNCESGKYSYGGHLYQDWKPFKNLTTSEAIQKSSNICGIKIGQKLGSKKISDSLKDFGFGNSGSTSEFPEAMAGQIPQPSQLSEPDYIALITTGYTGAPGFYVTPLEVVMAYAAIANEGRLMKPILSSEPDSSVKFMKQVISPETSKQMKVILSDTVKKGTGTNAQSRLYTTAGKTSTAFRPEPSENILVGGERGIAGFAGLAPVENSRLAVYVGIIDPMNTTKGDPHGNTHAAPVFREVIEKVLQQMNVSPDKSLSPE